MSLIYVCMCYFLLISFKLSASFVVILCVALLCHICLDVSREDWERICLLCTVMLSLWHCMSEHSTVQCLMFHFSNTESVRDVQFSPHIHHAFSAVSENGNVQQWDMRRPDRCYHQFTAHSGPVFACDWHPEVAWLATASRDKTIKVETKALPWFYPGTWGHNYIHYTNYWLGLIFLVCIYLKLNQETRCPDQNIWVCCSSG